MLDDVKKGDKVISDGKTYIALGGSDATGSFQAKDGKGVICSLSIQTAERDDANK